MRRVVLASCGRHGAILAQVPDAKAASVASLLASKSPPTHTWKEDTPAPGRPWRPTQNWYMRQRPLPRSTRGCSLHSLRKRGHRKSPFGCTTSMRTTNSHKPTSSSKHLLRNMAHRKPEQLPFGQTMYDREPSRVHHLRHHTLCLHQKCHQWHNIRSDGAISGLWSFSRKKSQIALVVECPRNIHPRSQAMVDTYLLP